MDIRLIAMDLDGTALQADRSTFSPRLIRALDLAHKKGIRIIPVTGRQIDMLPPALQPLPQWADLAVLCNGAKLYQLASGQLLEEFNLSANALQGLIAMTQARDMAIEFSHNSILHLTQRSLELQQCHPYLNFHVNTILADHGKIMDPLDPLTIMPVEKVNLPYIPEPQHQEVLQELQKLDAVACWCGENCMEVTHPEATKGTALLKVSRLTGIPLANIMALGDSGNDESMIRAAGLGVAMGNAPDFVKASADIVTETNENDGAAMVIERYALGW